MMDPAAAAPFLDRLIAATVDTVAFWRIAPFVEHARGAGRPGLHARPQRVFVNSDSLPESFRAKWSGRVEIISVADWRRHDPREAGVLYTLTPPRQWGRFVRVELSVSERLPRPAGQAPAHYASANTYYLMELDGEWVVVAWDGWIT